ncbi:hypothetical protein HCU01_35440 [Halomonas cupida]|uniref:Hemolysin n=1 Tax=Halomonas cupida TaxID=44933 RepID=A0A1M7KV91_9GAMM|nr:DUF333 domain-containing protein [Halomonas cupida]GEN25595.1 hypothetical protein HCU01_35440 [Halomonas cupida]SHM69391.1 hypothetical protein SAMN05660971_03626 [Halomonas cupida]
MKKTVLVGTVLSAVLLAGCNASQEAQTNDTSIGMPNPAAVHCESKGGTHEIKKTDAGETGTCHLPDGTSVDAWQLYRDDMGQQQ